MTEMVYGSMPSRVSEPVLPRWWRTIDKWSLTAILVLFGIGLLLGLAASVPLADRNGLEPYYYVKRQMAFGGMALIAMAGISMMSPALVRRVAILGFSVSFIGICLLPVLGTDYGKGAVRWFSFGFASVQPSEFLKPGFVVLTAWLMAAGQDLKGPAGKTYSFCLLLAVVGLLALQPDFGQTMIIVFGWSVIYFVAGAPIFLLVLVMGLVSLGGLLAYTSFEYVAKRIDGFLSPHRSIHQTLLTTLQGVSLQRWRAMHNALTVSHRIQEYVECSALMLSL